MYEQELKLTAKNGETLADVLTSSMIVQYAKQPPSSPLRFFAKYYDTDLNDLQRYQCSLRARLEGDKFRAALKLKGDIVEGMSSREEYECDIDGWLNKVGDLPDGEFKDRVNFWLTNDCLLEERVVVDMQRRIVNLDYQGTEIEVVADQGVIFGGNEQQQLYEIELELKSGQLEHITEIGKQFMEQFDLLPSTVTKHGIGLDLCKV